MPPLRARREDLPELCEHLIKKVAHRVGRPAKRIDRSALALLSSYPLPGNVRQLENILTSALLMTDRDVITGKDLTTVAAEEKVPIVDRKGAVEEYDRRILLEVLASASWNKRRAAQALGISRQTLYRRMSRYNIPKTPPSSDIGEISRD
jgi:transcriptional regulator with PAS, ATPase and Fis domain